jgi:hypothetical protein
MLFCIFKDLIDIKSGNFIALEDRFKPKEFFHKVANQVQSSLVRERVCFDIQMDSLPFLV